MALRTRLAASVGPHVDRGGEPDGPVDHHPHAHAELGVVGGALGRGVAQADLLGADALDPQLGVGAAAGGGGREGGVGQRGRARRRERHQSPVGSLAGVGSIEASGRSRAPVSLAGVGSSIEVGWRIGSPAAT